MQAQTIDQFLLTTPAAKQWMRVGARHHHGICLPLFSLHSNDSSGIGEFYDLVPLFGWCKSIGMDVIQLLPLNDTGNDSSPYNALSAFALNPIHLSLSHLPSVNLKPQSQELLKELRNLNSSPRVDYPKVRDLKFQFLRNYFADTYPLVSKNPDYLRFVSDNPWLANYARFKALKIKTNWQNWREWPSEWKTPVSFENLDEEAAFHAFLQYLCYQQFNDVKKKAGDQGIFLKGDIPILISRESADVWGSGSLFLTDYNAGAPQDMYNKEGQDWGFPLYNWQEMERQRYVWWTKRLETAAHYYDIYRIDHIVGFYRIWAVPQKSSPTNGWFMPPEQWKWLGDGEARMRQMLQSTNMLPIGEDLGTVPPEVRQNLHALGICGTKVIRWERYWNQDKRFIPYADYDPLSMSTVSTHDSETVKIWWENQPEEAQEFAKFKGWQYAQKLSEKQQYEMLRDSHHTSSLFHINLLQEYLALIPGMTASNPENERINIPGTVTDFNWSYRFRPSVEEIIGNSQLASSIKSLIGK